MSQTSGVWRSIIFFALRTVWTPSLSGIQRVIAAGGLAVGAWLVWNPAAFAPGLLWPLVALIIVAAACGTPIFAVNSGSGGNP